MGNSFMNLEQYNKALEEFSKTIEIEGPSPEVYCCMGAAYENLQQYDQGLKYFQNHPNLIPFMTKPGLVPAVARKTREMVSSLALL
jgi:tetratricopeptide (TPR) repeat protein